MGAAGATSAPPPPASTLQFVDVTRQAGIDFHHVNGASPDKHLVETMGSGGLFFDFDNNGWLDVFLVDGGSLADPTIARRARHRLYRNRRSEEHTSELQSLAYLVCRLLLEK